MLKTLFLLFAIVATKTCLAYTSLGWSSCSTASQDPSIRIERLSMLPMVYNIIKIINKI